MTKKLVLAAVIETVDQVESTVLTYDAFPRIVEKYRPGKGFSRNCNTHIRMKGRTSIHCYPSRANINANAAWPLAKRLTGDTLAVQVIGQYRPSRLHTKNCRSAEACFQVWHSVAITSHHVGVHQQLIAPHPRPEVSGSKPWSLRGSGSRADCR